MSGGSRRNDEHAFDDLLAANRAFADTFSLSGFDGVAAGVAVVTCMDSRIDPLGMLGLKPGDAKIFRNPGGRVEAAWRPSCSGCTCSVCGVLVIPHAVRHDPQLGGRTARARWRLRGQDASWQSFNVVGNQLDALQHDREAALAPAHPDRVAIGGFLLRRGLRAARPGLLSGPAPGGTVAFARLLLSGPASSYSGAQPGRQPRDGGRNGRCAALGRHRR